MLRSKENMTLLKKSTPYGVDSSRSHHTVSIARQVKQAERMPLREKKSQNSKLTHYQRSIENFKGFRDCSSYRKPPVKLKAKNSIGHWKAFNHHNLRYLDWTVYIFDSILYNFCKG